MKEEVFYKDWHWIWENHPWAITNLDIEVMKVSPKSKMIVKDESKNTKVEIWLETGPTEDGNPTHDHLLDCGGDTFEDAIISLRQNLEQEY